MRSCRPEEVVPYFHNWCVSDVFFCSVNVSDLRVWTGMLVFWTLQTICFALNSENNDKKAAHAFIAFICELLSALLLSMPYF